MLDNRVTRFPGGITNARDNGLFSDMPVLDYAVVHDYLDDFDYYTGPVAAGTTNGYTLTGTGATVTMVALDGGAISLNGLTTGFIAALQRATGNFQLADGFATWYEIVAGLSTLASSAQMIAGLTNVTGTPFTGGQITDGIWFSSDAAGAGALSINFAVGGAVTSLALGVNLVAGQQATLKFYWDGGLYGTPNGRIIAEASGPGVTASARVEMLPQAAFPGATLLAPVWAVKATAGTPSLVIDLTEAVKARVNPNATPTF